MYLQCLISICIAVPHIYLYLIYVYLQYIISYLFVSTVLCIYLYEYLQCLISICTLSTCTCSNRAWIRLPRLPQGQIDKRKGLRLHKLRWVTACEFESYSISISLCFLLFSSSFFARGRFPKGHCVCARVDLFSVPSQQSISPPCCVERLIFRSNRKKYEHLMKLLRN